MTSEEWHNRYLEEPYSAFEDAVGDHAVMQRCLNQTARTLESVLEGQLSADIENALRKQLNEIYATLNYID